MREGTAGDFGIHPNIRPKLTSAKIKGKYENQTFNLACWRSARSNALAPDSSDHGRTLGVSHGRNYERDLTTDKNMSEIQTRLLKFCLKPEEITGDIEIKNARVRELVNWMARYGEGNANPKWLAPHAAELAHYIAEIKDL
jgi:hypothetical protein